MSKSFYITTPIYYPSGNLHMGNAYTTILADSIARHKKAQGYDVFFLTGTDEHGQKIQKVAHDAGREPKEYVDEIVVGIRELWETLNINYDKFIRTTDDYHVKAVQDIFQKLYDQGDIYKSTYDGWYCTPCESFWTETQVGSSVGGSDSPESAAGAPETAPPTSATAPSIVGDAVPGVPPSKDNIHPETCILNPVSYNCPECKRAVEKASEESYFFKMGKYTDKLREHIEKNENFIRPITRRNEVLSFINSGVEDLCVSRTTFNWGIKVPFDEKHVVYVWLDALTNYINALRHCEEKSATSTKQSSDFDKFWSAAHHLVGKDILRFHAIIWPCLLLALDLPLPQQIFAHGWLLIGRDGKMSKSQGEKADPHFFVERYGVDAVRYYALRELPYGEDSVFSMERFLDRLNQDLANDLGNLVSRTTAMAEKYFGGVVGAAIGRPPNGADSVLSVGDAALGVPPHSTSSQSSVGGAVSGTPYVENEDNPFDMLKEEIPRKAHALFDEFRFNDGLREIWTLVSHCNKYIDITTPWNLAKDEANLDRLQQVMYNLLDGIRIVAGLIAPALPETSAKILDQIGWNGTHFATKKGDALFPRVDIAKELESLS